MLEKCIARKMPVAMLTAHALSAEALKKSYEMGARAYLPKEKLGEIVPFLEDVLTCEFATGWDRLLAKLQGFFNQKFELDWDKKAGISRVWKDLREL